MKTKPCRYVLALMLCILWSGMALTLAAENDAELLKQTTAILETRNLNDVSKGAAMFLRLAIDGNTNKAYSSLFKTSESVKKLISASEGFKLLNRHASKVSDFDLVAFRMVSTSLFSLVYTITTPEGPFALRMDFTLFERKLTLSDIRVTHKWDNMLRLIDRATQLPAALSIGIKPNHPGPDQK